MGLIYKSYLVTLNQRVPGSSPGAPTNKINSLNRKSLRSSGKRRVSTPESRCAAPRAFTFVR